MRRAEVTRNKFNPIFMMADSDARDWTLSAKPAQQRMIAEYTL